VKPPFAGTYGKGRSKQDGAPLRRASSPNSLISLIVTLYYSPHVKEEYKLGISQMTNYQNDADALFAKMKTTTSVEESQKLVSSAREILKSISNDQKYVGEIRTKMVAHTVSLRKEKPKGKPVEGTERQIGDRYYIYIDGSWAPYSPK
jgi:hypothetical protein